MRASSRAQEDQALHPLQKDLAARLALLAIAFEAGKGQLPKALHVRIPQKKGVAQNGGHAPDAQCHAQNQAAFRGSLGIEFLR